MADRIALMRRGRIVQEGAPAQLYDHPVDPFAAGFFGEINVLEGIVESGGVVTPVGIVAADGLAAGSRVAVLIRPEGLAIGAEGAGATVASARPMGPCSLVGLRLDDGGAVLESRLPLSEPPPEGARVRVNLDPTKAFVFARDDVHMKDVRAAEEGRER